MELKGRRELFCREYLAKNLNGTNSAIAAGYSVDRARKTASELLAEEEVQDRIAELATERNQELKIEARDVLVELLRMLNSDVAQAFNEDGSLKPIHEIPLDCRRMIAGVKMKDGLIAEIKFWSKEKGAELLARHLSLLNDKLKLDATDLAEAIAAARGRVDSIV